MVPSERFNTCLIISKSYYNHYYLIPGEDLSSVGVIVADVGDEKSLLEMCAQTKLVINCCGPYRLYGEPVVKAAVENKANYIDISGEPQVRN